MEANWITISESNIFGENAQIDYGHFQSLGGA